MDRNVLFGQTWWGQQWLAILMNKFDKQVFVKGGFYVQKGGVEQVFINKESIVEGKVRGVGAIIYQQRLENKGWTTAKKELLLENLQRQRFLLTQLLNQQFRKDIVVLLEEIGLDIFSNDGLMTCSCTGQKPCKHLAAVVLALTHQIDKNPLLLFQLNGLDIKKALEERGLIISNKTAQEIATLRSFVELSSTFNVPDDSYKLEDLDFSVIDNQWKKYLNILTDNPLFYPNNFKEKLAQTTKKAYQIYQKQVYEFSDYETLHQQLKRTKDVALIINMENQVLNLFAIDDANNNKPLFATDRALSDCIAVLETIELAALPLYADAFIALHRVYRFAIKLLKEQNFLPRLIACPKGYLVQWIPAYNINSDVADLIKKLVISSPSDLLLLDDDGLKRLEANEQIINLCQLFLSHYIQLAAELVLDNDVPAQYKVLYCFFSGLPTAFNKTEEGNIPSLIHAWLQPYYLGQQPFTPVLKVIEVEGDEAVFIIELLVKNNLENSEKPIALNSFLKQKKYAPQHLVLLQEWNRLLPYFADLEPLLNKEETHSKSYTGGAFEQVFFEILPILKMLQIEVILPRSLKQLTRPRLGWSISKKKNNTAKGKSFLNIKSLLELNWKIALGDEMIEVMEFLKMMKGKSGLVKHKEQYIYLDKEALQKIMEQLQQPPVATANQIIHAALCNEYNEIPIDLGNGVSDLINELRESPIVPIPQTLNASLRPYQEVGFSWMHKNAQLGLGSLIADDMGLGKTLQIITLLLKFKEEGRLDNQQVLVVVPTSLLTNWINELQKFAPLLSATTYHGVKRKLSKEVDIIITTYGIARLDLKQLNQLDLYCTIIDEAQHIKNVNTAQTEAIKSIQSTLNIAMSGTPVENRLSEYWSIMDFVNPDYLGSIAQFTEDYCIPIEKDYDQHKLENFRNMTAPFLLRRLKSDKSIIQDLPDKIEQNYYATLQQEQAEIYQKIVTDTLQELSLCKDDKKKRQGLILKLMGGLKQVCNHPYQYLRMGRQGPECSGKSQVLMDLLTRIHVQQEKTLIFTQYRKMGNLMVQWIQQYFGVVPMYLHGGCSRKERDAMVHAFQNDKQQTIFVLSLKAAGTGLNLTAANHVIHYDLWWNPAVEAQATDRAYRIGQKKNVQVYRFITQGTLEEKIDAMIQSKKELANMTVSTGEQWLGDLSDDELRNLLST